MHSKALECRQPSLNTLFTIGHSNWELPPFAAILRDAKANLLIDVRSSPYSSRLPQFNQPTLTKLPEAEGIAYLYLGEELGGRPDDPSAYKPNGVVDYSARRQSFAFRAGIERVMCELENHSLALMCAEEDPLDCHRFLMICPELVALGIQPLHLRRGAPAETQESAENRLLAANGFESVAQNTLFPELRADSLEQAYTLQAEKCAFRVDPQALAGW